MADLCGLLKGKKHRWLVTGAAGFIGSHLVEELLACGQMVTGLDNFSSGRRSNLEEVRRAVGDDAWSRFTLVEGSVEDTTVLRSACVGQDFVLHHAALVSVPVSIAEPERTHRVNVVGFRNLLEAARATGVRRVVYATSSAVYGDEKSLPAREGREGSVLSPYADSKKINEDDALAQSGWGVSCVGLRYFNVFGPRQDHKSDYAAVIPMWVRALLRREAVYINGDGDTTRDFCYVKDVVQANFRAALGELRSAATVFNVATGTQTSLLELFRVLDGAAELEESSEPQFRAFRSGDVRHSVADIGKIRDQLGFHPSTSLAEGIRLAMPWYRKSLV